VRIDGPDRLQPQNTPDPLQQLPKSPGSGQAPGSKPEVGQEAIATTWARYVRAAMAAEDINEQAVAEARRLLASGQLDTPEAARRAAEALVNHGI